jgi:hypothetical protein
MYFPINPRTTCVSVRRLYPNSADRRKLYRALETRISMYTEIGNHPVSISLVKKHPIFTGERANPHSGRLKQTD